MPKGSCNCGKFTYEVPDDAQATVVCHCKPCQKFAGSNGSTNGIVPRDKYKHLSGEAVTWTRKGDSGKEVTNGYCDTCYTLLWVDIEAMDGVKVFKVGTIDDQSFLDSHPAVQEIYNKNRPSCLAALEGAAQKEAA